MAKCLESARVEPKAPAHRQACPGPARPRHGDARGPRAPIAVEEVQDLDPLVAPRHLAPLRLQLLCGETAARRHCCALRPRLQRSEKLPGHDAVLNEEPHRPQARKIKY